MSLLLDALNRASLDKAALAAAARGKPATPATLAVQNEQIEPAPPIGTGAIQTDVASAFLSRPHPNPLPGGEGISPHQFESPPSGTVDRAAVPDLSSDAVAPPAWPSLQRSALNAEPEVMAVQPGQTAPAVTAEPLPLATSAPADTQAGLSLAPQVQEPTPPTSPAFASPAHARPIPDLVPFAAPQAGTPAASTDAFFAHTAEPAATGVRADSRADSRPDNGSRVAQNMVRAKKPPSGESRTRVIVLASVAAALLLATAVGSIFLGVFGDPMVLAQHMGLAAPPLLVSPPVVLAAATTAPAPEAAPAASSDARAVSAATTAAAAPAPAATELRPTPQAAAPKPVAARSVGQTPRRSRTATAVPASNLACPPGTLPPDCRAASPAANSGQNLQPSVQSRSSGPSILEQGYSALTQGRLQDAESIYLRALKVNPEERDALLGMAYIAQKQQRPDDAQVFYRRVLRQEPDNAVARAGLLSLNALGNPQNFGTQSRQLAEQNPASAAAQSMLGHALVRQNRLADARLAFARALELEPGVARHAFNLAVALDRLHDYPAAQRYYEQAVALLAQSGGERANGFALADVQLRLAQLRSAP